MDQTPHSQTQYVDPLLLLQNLDLCLREAQTALLSSNLTQLELQTLRQRDLCEQIRNCAHLASRPPNDLILAAQGCKRAARLQGALLKRLQRGLGLLTLFRAHRSVTYDPPRQLASVSGGAV